MTNRPASMKTYRQRGGTRVRMEIGLDELDLRRMASLGYVQQQRGGKTPSNSLVISRALELAVKEIDGEEAAAGEGA